MTASIGRTLLPPLLCLTAMLALVAPGSAAASVCSGFYSSNFRLAQGKLDPPVPSRAKPAKGSRITEPNFGTCLVRATDYKAEPTKNFARNDYSRRQAFNANSTYFLIYSDGGQWNLYDANTLQYIRALTPLAGDAEPQWHPTDPNTLYYVPLNGGTTLRKVDVRTNASSVVANFVGKLPAWANNAAHIWTHSEGSPSANGRYWGFVVQDNSFNTLGYFTWDLQQGKVIGSRREPTSDLDNVSMSAQGRWFVATGNEVWAWSPDFTRKKKLANVGGVHTDLGIGANGNDVFVSVDFQSNNGDVYYVDLDSCPSVSASASSAPVCPRTVLFAMYTDGGYATPHFSMKAFDKPGWLLLSMYNSYSNDRGPPWYREKVMAIKLAASPKFYPLADTRRVAVTSGGDLDNANYWAEPHGSVNRDFTRIIYNSNWGNGAGLDVDAYIIEIPPTAFGDGGSPPPAPPPPPPTTPPPRTGGPVTGGNLPPVLGSRSNNGTASSGTSALTRRSASTLDGTQTVSIGCQACARLEQARVAWVGFAHYLAGNARSAFTAARLAFEPALDRPARRVVQSRGSIQRTAAPLLPRRARVEANTTPALRNDAPSKATADNETTNTAEASAGRMAPRTMANACRARSADAVPHRTAFGKECNLVRSIR